MSFTDLHQNWALLNSDICWWLSPCACFSHVVLLPPFILFCSMYMHKTLPGMRKFADRCKPPLPGHALTAVQDLFMIPTTSALGDTEVTHWTPQLPCTDYAELRSAHSWVLPPPGLPGPQRRCFDCIAAVSFCSCTCLPRFPPSPRRSCLISKLAGFNPSSSVPGWGLKTCNKQIEVYDIIIANISALFSSQGGEFWNERRSEACQCMKFYGLMSQNYSTSQLGATSVLWMLLKTKANSK